MNAKAAGGSEGSGLAYTIQVFCPNYFRSQTFIISYEETKIKRDELSESKVKERV